MSFFRRQTTRIALDAANVTVVPRLLPAVQVGVHPGSASAAAQGAARGSSLSPIRPALTSTTCNPEWRRLFSIARRLRDELHTSPPKLNVGVSAKAQHAADDAESEQPGSVPVADSPPLRMQRLRTSLAARITNLLDGLLARATTAGQYINVYTGTDYSAIENLRQDISEQEALVRTAHSVVKEAKSNYDVAQSTQATAQREIVSLLERKSSWAPADLERYMLLVRSEHSNEQDVQSAKDFLLAAERDLEQSRSLLERLERKRYHEEQVWSDTIRRNSTWVTFGLMGVNILLLLAQIVVFEPYRRRKIVREIELALSKRSLPTTSMLNGEIVQGASFEQTRHDEDRLVAYVMPDTSGAKPSQDEISPGNEQSLTEVADKPRGNSQSTEGLNHGSPWRDAIPAYLKSQADRVPDLFSTRLVHLSRVEMTTVVLQSIAAGAIGTALVLQLFRT